MNIGFAFASLSSARGRAQPTGGYCDAREIPRCRPDVDKVGGGVKWGHSIDDQLDADMVRLLAVAIVRACEGAARGGGEEPHEKVCV